MIEDQPLISYDILIDVWLVGGIIFGIVGCLIYTWPKKLPLTTQTNRKTGVNEHGLIDRWLPLFLAILAGPPLIAKLLYNTRGHWTALGIVAGVIMVLVGFAKFVPWKASGTPVPTVEPVEPYRPPWPVQPPQIVAQYIPPTEPPPAMWTAPIGDDEPLFRRPGQ